VLRRIILDMGGRDPSSCTNASHRVFASDFDELGIVFEPFAEVVERLGWDFVAVPQRREPPAWHPRPPRPQDMGRTATDGY
jgi:hypothetical protein